MAENYRIEIAWGDSQGQVLLEMEVAPGTTLMEAINSSGIRDRVPGIEVNEARLGIFSRKKSPDYILQNGDRIEIYRPLLADPKEVRRQRAREER